MRQPQVFRTDIGEFAATFCETGHKIAHLIPLNLRPGERSGCATVACVCGTDGQVERLATLEEAGVFWDDMASMADEYLATSRY